MDRPLTNETQTAIRTLCESIARRDQLGDDAQEELRGHIEDKVIAYLEGKQALSEADALLLAREHFGQVPLRSRHESVPKELTRRLVVITAAMLLARAITTTFCIVGGLPASILVDQKYLWVASLATSAFYNAATCSLVILFLALVVKGRIPNLLNRLVHASSWKVVLILTGFGVITWSLVPSLVWEWHDPNVTDAFTVRAHLVGINVIRAIAAVVSCVIWMRWCAPQRRHVGVAAVTWAAFLIAHPVFLKVFGSSAMVVANQELPTNTALFETARGLQVSSFYMSTTHVAFPQVIAMVVVTAFVSYVLYSIAVHFRQRIQVAA